MSKKSSNPPPKRDGINESVNSNQRSPSEIKPPPPPPPPKKK